MPSNTSSFSRGVINPCKCPSKKGPWCCFPDSQPDSLNFFTRRPNPRYPLLYTNFHPMHSPQVLSFVDRVQMSLRSCCGAGATPFACGCGPHAPVLVGVSCHCDYTTRRDLDNERCWAEHCDNQVSGVGQCQDCNSCQSRMENGPVYGCG